MNNEFYEHKRSDAVKWVIVFVLIAVLLGGMVAALVFAVPSADEAEKGGNGDGLTDVSEGAVTLSAGIASWITISIGRRWRLSEPMGKTSNGPFSVIGMIGRCWSAAIW